jgi:microcystin-dependent protein
MTQPFIGEIRWLPFSRTPTGWLPCDGSLTSIGQFDTLYSLIGTAYGGDGVSTFATPDLRGRVPIHQGTGQGLTPRVIGQSSGAETITLQSNQTGHGHVLVATSNAATTTTPNADTPLSLAQVAAGDTLYCSGATTTLSATLGSSSVSMIGVGTPHENCAPTLPVSAFICWSGIYPSQG